MTGRTAPARQSSDDMTVVDSRRHLKSIRVGDVRGYASLFPIAAGEGSRVYRYDVEITWRVNDKITKCLTKTACDDSMRVLNRGLCASIIAAISRRQAFMKNAGGDFVNRYVYDGKKNLFLQKEADYEEHIFTVEQAEVHRDRAMFLKWPVTVKIQKSQNFILSLCDFESSLLESFDQQPDHSLRTFFEMLISQSFLNNVERYDILGPGTIYEKRGKNSECDGVVLKRGIKKGVRFIERAPSEREGLPRPALVMDCVTSIFYPCLSIHDLLSNSHMGVNRIASFFRGVRGYLRHEPSRTFVFDGFSDSPMSQMRINREGQDIEFVEFYRVNKNHRILDKTMPAVRVESRERDSKCHFPPELFIVLPLQRVPLQKMTPKMSDTLLNDNSVAPYDRRNAIMEWARAIDNAFLEEFGVTIANDDMIRLNYIGQVRMPTNKPTGRLKFSEPAEIRNWCFASTPEISWQPLVSHARNCGMVINRPYIPLLREERVAEQLPRIMQECQERKITFVMLCDNRSEPSHEELKRCEVTYGIVTQHVTREKLSSAKFGTLLNIALKMNAKNGGINYIPQFSILPNVPQPRYRQSPSLCLASDSVFVFAYDVSHPAPATTHGRSKLWSMDLKDYKSLEPSVVGFSANMARNSQNFIGDYFYQPSRKESVSGEKISETMTYCLRKAKANQGDNFHPETIVIIRDGVSEGQYEMVMKTELPGLRKAVMQVTNKKSGDIKFLLVVVGKRHGKRFFEDQTDKEKCKNLGNPAVIDTTVVRPDLHEFYMMSHFPLRGTAKVPQYAVLVNDYKIPPDSIKDFLNTLCRHHQVTSSAVSTPAPVLLAHELAKRGRNNYLTSRNDADRHEYLTIRDDDREFVELNGKLSYRNLPAINNNRFTA